MITRRKLLKNLSSLPLAGSLAGTPMLAPQATKAGPFQRDYFKELGVRTFINAAGTYTMLTASMMPKEVTDSINYAAKSYVSLDELQDKVGEQIASLLHCEAATVTAGAASAITLGTAGVLSGLDENKVIRIPHLKKSGMKTEVIMQKAHEFGYGHAIRNCGVNIRYVETRKQLEKAINKKTALLFFLNANNNLGKINDEEWVEVAKKYGIPSFNDCAADVPPVENLWKYTKMGFDLVCFSGGKGLRGPQSAGLLLGRKDLIEAARLHAPPRGNTVGRGMKVNKEEILAMLVALEMYLERDHEKEWKMWEDQVAFIANHLTDVKGIKSEIFVPDIANHVPTLKITWDDIKIKLDNEGAHEALKKGSPSIEVAGWNGNQIQITTWMMVPGQEKIVAERVRQVFLDAST